MTASSGRVVQKRCQRLMRENGAPPKRASAGRRRRPEAQTKKNQTPKATGFSEPCAGCADVVTRRGLVCVFVSQKQRWRRRGRRRPTAHRAVVIPTIRVPDCSDTNKRAPLKRCSLVGRVVQKRCREDSCHSEIIALMQNGKAHKQTGQSGGLPRYG